MKKAACTVLALVGVAWLGGCAAGDTTDQGVIPTGTGGTGGAGASAGTSGGGASGKSNGGSSGKSGSSQGGEAGVGGDGGTSAGGTSAGGSSAGGNGGTTPTGGNGGVGGSGGSNGGTAGVGAGGSGPSTCGNGVVEGTEECDGAPAIDCATLTGDDTAAGVPICNSNCVVVDTPCQTCFDNIQNHGETDADCGGPCAEEYDAKCELGQGCTKNEDCAQGACIQDTCQDFTLQIVPNTALISAGANGAKNVTVQVVPSGGFSQPVAFSIDTPPANVNASITTANPAFPNATLNLSTMSQTPQAASPLKVDGTAFGLVRSATVDVTITDAAAEICNGVDDNGNGQTDEGDPGGGGTCTANAALGECKKGILHCVNGDVVCVPASPSPETCDDLDNDCDGVVDNGNPGGGAACSTGQLGVCGAGIRTCVAGALPCMQVNSPTTEVCDGLDNDCDGTVDDSISQVGLPCTAPGFLGQCQFGTYVCPVVAPFALTCNHPLPGTIQETCNGMDDDCNGTIDDPLSLNNQPCMTGLPGVCSTGSTLCTQGSLTCNATIGVGQQTEICDNKDNDCDGMVDDLNANSACSSQFPGAAGVQSWNCGAGSCSIVTCSAGKADINGAISDGCECNTDSYQNSCGAAGSVSVPSGGTTQMIGKIESAAGSDWLTFNFTVPAVGAAYHPKIELTDSGGGQFGMDINSICGTAAGCSPLGDGIDTETGINVNVWEQNYNAYVAGAGCCVDNTSRVASVKVRVYRKLADNPTCGQYIVTATNL